MVDVAHDGDDRRARFGLLRIVGAVEQTLFDVGLGDATHGVAHFFGDELGGVGIDHVVDLQHLPLLHQQADHVDRALGHSVGEIGNADRLRNDDFAYELFLRLVRSLSFEPLGAAAERGDRTLAYFIGAQCRHEREAATLLLGAAARGGTRGCRGTRGARTARYARPIVIFGLERHAAARPFDLVFAQPLLGDFASLAFGFLVVLATVLLLALARVGGLAVGTVPGFARVAPAGGLFGDLALFGFAHARIGKRMSARRALLFGQRTQHDA